MLAEFDHVVAVGGDNVINMLKNVDSLTTSLAGMSRELEGTLRDNRTNLDSTIANIEQTTRKTTELIDDLQVTLAQFRIMVTNNGTNFAEIMENFQYASQNLEEFSRVIKERPWLLVRKSSPPERKLP